MKNHHGKSLAWRVKKYLNENKSKNGKAKLPKNATWLICIAGVILLVCAGSMFISQLVDYSKSSKIYESTVDEYVSSKYNDESDTDNADEDKADEDKADWKDFVDVDIAKLREENEDVIGWIYFENEDISYPVLYSVDNSNYLRRAYTGESMSAGSIFMEMENNRDFSDAHTIIYGHNMKDLSMFGKLKYYIRDTDYIEGHEYFQIITEKVKYRYKIFSIKVVADDSDIYTVYKVGSQDFEAFVRNAVQNGNYLDANENVRDDDHIITLSTCVNDDRLVVTALRCDECLVNNYGEHL